MGVTRRSRAGRAEASVLPPSKDERRQRQRRDGQECQRRMHGKEHHNDHERAQQADHHQHDGQQHSEDGTGDQPRLAAAAGLCLAGRFVHFEGRIMRGRVPGKLRQPRATSDNETPLGSVGRLVWQAARAGGGVVKWAAYRPVL